MSMTLTCLQSGFSFIFFFYTKFYFFEWKTVILIEFNDNETKYKFYMDDTIIMRNSFHVYTYIKIISVEEEILEKMLIMKKSEKLENIFNTSKWC